jgi:hypothetical protein
VPDRFEIAIWGDDELRLCAGQACHKATAVEGVLAWQELSTRSSRGMDLRDDDGGPGTSGTDEMRRPESSSERHVGWLHASEEDSL